MERHEDELFVEAIVKAIVDNPDDVRVTRTVDEMGVLITIDVNDKDIGCVVGRKGRTIQSVRLLAKIVGAKNKARVNVKLNQPDRPDRPAGASEHVDTGADDLDLEI